MKQLTIITCFVILALVATNAQAQIKIPKKLNTTSAVQVNVPDEDFTNDILKALSPNKSLGLSPQKALKLTNNNKSFVDKALGVINGSASDDEKNNKLGILQSDRKNFIENLLGEGKASQYYTLVKKQIEPLVKKYAMAKFFM